MKERRIAVETSLYPEIQAHWEEYSGIEDYELTVHPNHNCVMLKKVQGTHPFDHTRFDIFYYPFSRS